MPNKKGEGVSFVDINVGDKVRVRKGEEEYIGVLMPHHELSDKNCIIIKLDNGYNIGVDSREARVEKLEGKIEPEKFKIKKPEFDAKKPTISILSTGGTIASKLDYRTGGVVPAFSPEEIIFAVPELAEFANIKGREIMNFLSENISSEEYQIMAREIEKEIREGVDGVILLHGTDTLQYTASALSFILQELPVPIIIVGAQRSSDRGSSDAAMNLICAGRFIAESDFAEVGVCMHATPNDTYSFIHQATKVRKLHTSRRDAFKSIDVLPWAKVWVDGKIEWLREGYKKKDKKRSLRVYDKMEKKVALIKMTPDFSIDILEFFEKNGYKGIVIEGTGLGHAPKRIFETIKKMVENGCVVAMTSQCVYGRVNMNVYATGRDLQKMGVIPCEDILPETAYIKLKWALGNFPEKAKEKLSENIAGEITLRSELRI